MPFSCTFQLNNGAIEPSDCVHFIAYIDSSFGKFQTEEVPIADVTFNGNSAKIFTTCDCFPSSKGQLVVGDKIDASTKIAFFATNGEDIPYNRPYAKIIQ